MFAFQKRRTPEQDLAFCATVVERLGATNGKAYAPIDPRYHSLATPETEKDGVKSKFVYSYADNPLIVRSNAINIGIDNLRVTLRAEALAREALIALDGREDEDAVMMLKNAQKFANLLTTFHRVVWGIAEPASDDYAQREMHAQAAAKRKVKAIETGRHQDAKTEEFY